MTARNDADEVAEQWSTLVDAELRHRGYTDDDLAAMDGGRKHTDACELTDHGYSCEGEDGKPLHPEHDEADEIAGIIGRAFGWI